MAEIIKEGGLDEGKAVPLDPIRTYQVKARTGSETHGSLILSRISGSDVDQFIRSLLQEVVVILMPLDTHDRTNGEALTLRMSVTFEYVSQSKGSINR